MKIENDPIIILLECYDELYDYGKKAKIFYDETLRKRWKFLGCWGYTDFSSNIPEIHISAWLPFYHVPEILAHELAHVAAGFEAKHRLKWEREFALIHKTYLAKVELHKRNFETS